MPKRINRRDALKTSGWMAALGLTPAATAATSPSNEIYTRIGAKPFINLTATYTINGGALTLPEVKRAMEEAGHWPVNLDELMEKVGAHIAKLMGAESAMVTCGCAAALAHATAGCVAGTDPEKMQQLPDLTGLRNEVVVARQSRNQYDHAVRTVGVKMVEIQRPEELERAINDRTAMLFMLGTGESKGPVKLEHLVDAGKRHSLPVLVDAAAELPFVPNPYLARGADLVAYSGGKFLRGPQCAGALLGRKDLVRAAWANSSPHHAFGRMMKVGKEEIMGMVAALEVWRNSYDLKAEYKRWEGWFGDIASRVSRIDGVKTEIRPAAGASPFPVLNVEWDRTRTGITAGEVGRMLLDGSPRIMSHAEGEGTSFIIRPVAMKEGESKIVARRLEEVLRGAPKPVSKESVLPPSVDVAGDWQVNIAFEVGSTTHRLSLKMDGARVTGAHHGRLAQGNVQGRVEGSEIHLRSGLRYEGSVLSYDFRGVVREGRIMGTVSLGEYGSAKFEAVRS